MTILSENRIRRFKNRLLQKKASPLMREGGPHGLKPVPSCEPDAEGNRIIYTQKIVAFFFETFQGTGSFDAEQHVANLFMLFKEFSQKPDQVVFKSDMKISETLIHEADNKTRIEHLTRNMIYSYFDRLEQADGTEGKKLLSRDLSRIIKLSNSGRDCRELIENTVEQLAASLQTVKSWRECVQEMNIASLACRLAGAGLPKIDPSIISKFIAASREELQTHVDLLEKILNTREQIISQEADPKKFRNGMRKLDQAARGLLKKLDDYFYFADKFKGILGISIESLIGKSDESVKKVVAKLFFDYPDAAVPPVFSQVRNRFRCVCGYPGLAAYCRTLKESDTYSSFYLAPFKSYYDQLLIQMSRMETQPKDNLVQTLRNCLAELDKAVDALGLGPADLVDKKEKLIKKYMASFKILPVEQINSLMSMSDYVCKITGRKKGLFLDTIKKTLISGCSSALRSIETEGLSDDDLRIQMLKILYNYSINYHPKRFFHQHFFEACIGIPGEELSEEFEAFQRRNKRLSLVLLRVFAEQNDASNLVPGKYSDFAAKIMGSAG